jgi:YegS/Rv2252/BmrU family lipid kinase
VADKSTKALFIINKFSGTGSHSTLEDLMRETCNENNTTCQIEYTQSRGHAVTLASDASKQGYDYVIAVGGDGTINEVARGLLNTPTTMGIVPRGSGNGLARHLGISVKVAEAVDRLFDSTIVGMDTLMINDKLSLNVSGIGFDGHIANLFAGKTVRGLFGYVKLSVEEFFNFQEFDAEISIGGKTLSRNAFIIAIANSSQYGNNIKIAPTASVCDGLLQISVMKKVPAYRFDFIYSFLRGTLVSSDLFESIEGSDLTIKTTKPIAYHIDGEPSGSDSNFTISLRPASLKILVPKSSFQNGM